MSEFVYLYRNPPSPPKSPQQLQEQMQRWLVWFKEMERTGHLAVYGHPLGHEGGAVVRGQHTVSDGPYAETKDIVVGFSVIEAKDLAEAIDLARQHPIHAQGGMVEVRPVQKL